MLASGKQGAHRQRPVIDVDYFFCRQNTYRLVTKVTLST